MLYRRLVVLFSLLVLDWTLYFEQIAQDGLIGTPGSMIVSVRTSIYGYCKVNKICCLLRLGYLPLLV